MDFNVLRPAGSVERLLGGLTADALDLSGALEPRRIFDALVGTAPESGSQDGSGSRSIASMAYGEAAAIVSPDPLRAIDWGTKLPTKVVDVYFAPAGIYLDGVKDFGKTFAWTTFEKQQVLGALAEIQTFTNLQFRTTTSSLGAEFRLGLMDLSQVDAVAFMQPPGEPHAGLFGFDPYYFRLIDADSRNPLLSSGGFIHAILLEELGHGLGLAHAHDDGGTSTILKGVDPANPVGSFGIGGLNQGVFTAMNYNEGWPGGPHGAAYMDENYIYVNDFGYEATMMALDVAVLQRKYGANMAHATGANVYCLPDVNRIGTFFQCIWDAGGVDVLRYDGTRDATLDLRQATLVGEIGGGGYISYAKGIRGGFTIAAGVVIENAIGGSADDVMIGNAAGNRLTGRDGDDALDGGRGADRMKGGRGDDAYSVDNTRDLVIEKPDAGTDTVRSTISYVLPSRVERLILDGDRGLKGTGNGLDNKITGNDGANRLLGKNGDDRLTGLDGNDALDGGRGADRMEGGRGDDLYSVDNTGDLVIEKPDAGTDTVHSTISYALPGRVERLVLEGSRGLSGTGNGLDNKITGNDGGNRLFGENGDDRLNGGGGDDRLDGGRGADRMAGGRGDDTYHVDNAGDLTIEKRSAGTDSVRSTISLTLAAEVEDLLLSGEDAIDGTGNDLSNRLSGNGAANRLDGGAGNDELRGKLGTDTLNGDTGADTFVFRTAGEAGIGASRDAIVDFAPGEDLIDISRIDACTLSPGDQEFWFIGAAAFSGTTQELRYADGIVAGDANGDELADFEIAIGNFASLSTEDFLL